MLKKMFYRGGGLLASIALVFASLSNGMACAFFFHQPEVPEGVKRLKEK